MNTVFDYPIWSLFKPYARLVGQGNRANVDLLQLPDDLRAAALAITTPCVACGNEIHPFRCRAASQRARIANRPEERRLFYAATCAATVNPGCSRTTQARDHQRKVRDILGAQREAKRMVLIKLIDPSGMVLQETKCDLLEPIRIRPSRSTYEIEISYENKG
jgi:hypothetical protein